MANPNYPIRVVSQKTGLSSHVIRMWERRYGAILPQRTETNRRLYSDGDVERLTLLGQLIRIGYSISQLSELSDADLISLIPKKAVIGHQQVSFAGPALDQAIQEALLCAQRFDGHSLERVIQNVERNYDQLSLIEGFLAPLLSKVGEQWASGALSIACEHHVTDIMRSYLGRLSRHYAGPEAPLILLTTLPGHLHELGALMAAIEAIGSGWRAIHLGPNLPIDEIVAAARKTQPRLLGVSLICPYSDAHVEVQLAELAQALPRGVSLVIGGAAAQSYQTGKQIQDMASFRVYLSRAA